MYLKYQIKKLISLFIIIFQGEWAGSKGRDGLEMYNASADGLLTTASPHRPYPTSHRSPVKGLHDLPLTINTYTNGLDSDSGIR